MWELISCLRRTSYPWFEVGPLLLLPYPHDRTSLLNMHSSDVVIPGWNRFRNWIFIVISEIDGSNSDSDSIKKWNHNIHQDVMILGLEPIPI